MTGTLAIPMSLTLLNFHTMTLEEFHCHVVWAKTEGYYDDVVIIDYWNPFEFVPQSIEARAQLGYALLKEVDAFTAVMRILVTLPKEHWPSADNFDLKFQDNPEAVQDYPSLLQTNWHIRNAWGNLVPTAIDPASCGCTECCIGEYIPLRSANLGMIRDMIAGYIRNNTGELAWSSFEQTDDGWVQTFHSDWKP